MTSERLMADLDLETRWKIYRATWMLRSMGRRYYDGFRVPVIEETSPMVPTGVEEPSAFDVQVGTTMTFTFEKCYRVQDGECIEWANVLWNGIIVDWVPVEWIA